MPIDPVSNGTWIAVNDAGLAAALLNVNGQPISGPSGGCPKLSRGELIPRVMACATLADAERVSGRTEPQRYLPFRLVVVGGAAIAEFSSDGSSLRHRRAALGDRPRLFTSSGLGDALVDWPRRELFERMFAQRADWVRQQDAFHRHSWPDRRHLSVRMERDDARTVSCTVIEIDSTRAAVTYGSDPAEHAGPPLSIATNASPWMTVHGAARGDE